MTSEKLKKTILDEDRLMSEAERWLVRLSAPACHSRDRAAFAKWRLEDPSHGEAYDNAEALWAKTGYMLGDLGSDPEFDAMLAQARQPEIKSRWRPAAIAASVVVFVTVAAMLLNPSGTPPEKTKFYTTSVGERRTVNLVDGSQVLLDAATRLSVEYDETRRHLILLNGQARFTVAPEVNHPFVVDTAHGSVTALGTVFDVRSLSGTAAVTLLSGSVEVKNNVESAEEKRIVLQPLQQVVLSSGGKISGPVIIDAGVAGEWTQGRLVFRNEPLSKVAEELNRHSSRKIIVVDGLDQYKLQGTFNADDPETVIQTIRLLFPVQAVEEKNMVLLTHDRSR